MDTVRFLQKYKVEIFIFVLALAVRILFLGLSYSAHGGNLANTINAGDSYYDIGQNIIAGNGYSSATEPPYTPTSYRAPGMPYFIAWAYFLFGSYLAVILANIALGSIVPLLGMRIARYITDVRGISIAVGIFLALEPTGILLSSVLLSETLFAFLFALSLLYLFRYWKEKTPAPLLISAFLLGVSTLVRPTVEYLPVIIISLIIWEARDSLSRTVFLRVGLYILIFLATLSPWLYRNYQAFGVLGLSSQQGAALYAITVPSVLAIEHETNFSQEYNTEIAGPNETSFAQSAEYSKLALPILLNHPRALILLCINTAFSFFAYDGIFDVLRQIKFDGGMFAAMSRARIESGIALGTPTLLSLLFAPLATLRYLAALSTTPFALVFIGRVAWFLITIAFLLGAWRLLYQRPQSPYALSAVSIVAYLMLTTLLIGLTVNYRYRLPVNSLIVTIAAYEIIVVTSRFRKKFCVRGTR